MDDLDEMWMAVAVEEAKLSLLFGEVPIGAIVVHEGEVLARAHNMRETWQDPTAHAEMLALRQAAQRLRRWRLPGTTLYVTLEPCSMCAGAIVLARVDRLVYGATDPKAGACGSIVDIARHPMLNHRPSVRAGVLAETCGELLRDFFRSRR